MKTSILFGERGPCPVFLVDGKSAGLVRQLDLDMKEDGTLAVSKVHVSPNGRFGPFADEIPKVPTHPAFEIIP
jgi:sporulation protein YlmC with PRC-barrel domain